ncbi:hypothetical protein HWV62_1661 [Athelia sp. TMB]|nr:hypothetical protein HWV62_1661 [Athelia sp. TMB]
MASEIPTENVSDRFCADDADVTFRSCDGTLFKIHRKNLESCSEGFSPPPGVSSRDEIVSLTENKDTLDLLFQYIYPHRHPDLAEIDFKQLAELAEAAEKYQVFAAMTICNVYMTLMDKAERTALGVSPTLAFESFTPQVYIAWVSGRIEPRSPKTTLIIAFKCYRHVTMPSGWICLKVSANTARVNFQGIIIHNRRLDI